MEGSEPQGVGRLWEEDGAPPAMLHSLSLELRVPGIESDVGDGGMWRGGPFAANEGGGEHGKREGCGDEVGALVAVLGSL